VGPAPGDVAGRPGVVSQGRLPRRRPRSAADSLGPHRRHRGRHEPTEGSILFDGLDQKSLNDRDLRRPISFVLQDSYVFTDSIARLRFGYDTRLGDTGLASSGGQRQRSAGAR